MRPNIVFLHAHNTGVHVQPYGHAVPTPHLQQLAEQGVMFRQAFCVSPTCSPSRASFMTGQWPHTCGMHGLAHRGFQLRDYRRTLVHVLREAGYETVLSGLQHIAAGADMLGYDRHISPPPPWPGREVAERAVRFLREEHSRPFFLDVGVFETHTPYPDPDTCGIDTRYVRGPANLPDTPETRRDAGGLMASAREMDNAFGQVLAALDETQLADSTLVICLTDHGLQTPGHMTTLFDRGLQTFLVVRGPGGFAGGKLNDALVMHIDLFPTICDVAGIPVPDWVQGRSLLPLVREETTSVHDAIYGEINYHAAYDPQRCVRTSRWKYIRRYLDRSRPLLPNIDACATRDMLLRYGLAEQHQPAEALYDLVLDPMESDNLIADARYAAVVADMRQRLEAWMRETNDPLLRGKIPAPLGAMVNHPDGVHPEDRLERVGAGGDTI